MCVFLSIRADKANLQKRFDAKWVEEELFRTKYVQSAYDFPPWPVVAGNSPGQISFMHWGLIPSWVKDSPSASSIRSLTVNARAETLFEKPAFRQAAVHRHCLILADGFFEFRQLNGRKFPYYIRILQGRPFAMAGLYETWVDPATGEIIPTFSVITTEANSLMAMVHNSKRRMPVILTPDSEKVWLEEGQQSKKVLTPYPAEDMEAWPVSRLITSRGVERNTPEAQVRVEYSELSADEGQQGLLF